MAVCPALNYCDRWEDCVFKIGGWLVCTKAVNYVATRRANLRRIYPQGGGETSTSPAQKVETQSP